jgi:HSP20 family molecular chaperone IbpA
MTHSQRILVPLISAFLGGLAVWSVAKTHPQFFNASYPFRAGRILDAVFHHEAPRTIEDETFLGDFQWPDDAALENLHQHEDAHFVYMELSTSTLTPDSLETHIENGYVTISGNSEKESEISGTKTMTASQFSRTFPVPEGTDPDQMQVSQDKNKIILKFPKLRS